MTRPDSLLSRFDLLFIVLDNVDAGSDRDAADHILCSHRIRSNCVPVLGHNSILHHVQEETSTTNEDESARVWQPSHHSTNCPTANDSLPSNHAVLHPDFVQKYVHFARHHVEATLSDDARQRIASAYADLRMKADERTLPVRTRRHRK